MRCPNGILGLVIIPGTSKAPDQAGRAAEKAGYERLGPHIRRVITVPEGSSFHASIVRLVVSAYIMRKGKGSVFHFAYDLQEAVQLITEAKSAITPASAQIYEDIRAMRRALSQTREAK